MGFYTACNIAEFLSFQQLPPGMHLLVQLGKLEDAHKLRHD